MSRVARVAALLAVVGLGVLTLGVPTAAQIPRWPSEGPPPPLLPRDIQFPDYEIRQLDNGLQVVFVAANEQPAVNVRLLVRAGLSGDPEGMPGVASLAAQMLDQGTTTRSAQQIAESIDNIGGGLGVGAGSDLSFVNVLVMKDSLDFAFELLSDVARNPAYAPAEIERQRQQLLSGMQVSADEPAYVAETLFERLVYGLHPYGMPHNGTAEAVRTMTRDDLLAFHRKYYMPNNAILGIVGDVSAEEAFAGASRALGDWERGILPAPTQAETPPSARRLIVVDRPGAVQTAIRVGHVALPRAHPDYLALDLAVKVLGGEGGNRLGGVLRTGRQLTYSASADLSPRQYSGDLMAQTDTRSDATAEVLRLMVDEVARLQREPVGRRELQSAQDYLAGNFPLTIETPNAIAALVLEAIMYGLELDDITTYPARINAVTVNDIQRVSRAYLRPARLAMVLVGDASTFVDDLAGVGFPEFDVVPISELDLTAVDFRRRPAN